MLAIDRIRSRRRQRGATLFEYLIVVGLIGMVLLLGGRALYRYGDKLSAQAECVSALDCAGTAPGTQAYALTEAATAEDPPPCPITPPPPPRSIWQRGGDLLYGFFVDGAWGTATGIWDIVRHPGETGRALWDFGGAVVADPGDVANDLMWTVTRAWEENPERFIGSLAFEIVSWFAPPLKISKASWPARSTKVTRTTKATSHAVPPPYVPLPPIGPVVPPPRWWQVNQFPGLGTDINCTRCARAVDACLEGGASCARPMVDPRGKPMTALDPKDPTVYKEYLTEVLGLAMSSWKNGFDEAGLAAEAASWGDRAKGVVMVQYTVNGQRYGHAFNVAVDNGVVYFLDGQNGRIYSVDDLRQAFPHATYDILRTLDMPPGVTVP